MKENLALLMAIRKKGLTQKAFAKRVGDHPTLVSRIIRGFANLDEARKAKYAKILDRKVEDLFQD